MRHKKAEEYLSILGDKWTPGNDQVDLDALESDFKLIRETWGLSADSESLFEPRVLSYRTLANGFRILNHRVAAWWDFWHLDIPRPNLQNRQWKQLYIETRVVRHPHAAPTASFGVTRHPELHHTVQGRLPTILRQTQHNAMALAILRTLDSVPETENIKISLESQHIVDLLTSKLERYENSNWVDHDCDTTFMQSLVSVLRRPRAKANAVQAQTHPPPEDEHFIDTNGSHLIVGAQLASLSQSQIYKILLHEKARGTKTRAPTRTHLDLAKEAAGARTGSRPTDEELWRSTCSRQIAHKKIRAFLWRTMHDTLPCGHVWPNDPHPERALCPTCAVRETPDHILTECPDNGQKEIWKLARDLLAQKGIEMADPITLGDILSCGLPSSGAADAGKNRLFTIVMSELAWLIWTRRCKWVIEDEGSEEKRVSSPEANNLWHARMNSKLTFDLLATNIRKYKKKAFDKTLVHDTWTGVVEPEPELAPSLSASRNTGVLQYEFANNFLLVQLIVVG
ncbi:hypothetical protein D9611_000917 [Ephemerocybe angulata]|uniref:Reverse transcriptase zinc-binding domain-containing protein n=1 Tax=Ephemerocybe angulata TaxID=980116 RepID=A0A8H5F739_9AGAR|nr:hypothetical protein D9611_000917 [Tulosesus angulatus]